MSPKTRKAATAQKAPKANGSTSARARSSAEKTQAVGPDGTPIAEGRVAQMRQTYGFAKQVDPQITAWMLGAAALAFVVFLLIGFALGHPIIWGIAGIAAAALAATIVMARRTDAGAYKMIEGKPGAALAALSSVRRGGWYIEQEPIAMEGRPQGQDYSNVATVYRAVGRPGVVLIGEGPANRAKKLLLAEQKKVERLAPGAPVHLMRVGEGEDTTPIKKINWQMQKMRPVLTKEEVATVNKRLKAMTGVKTAIPAGMDPRRVRPTRPR